MVWLAVLVAGSLLPARGASAVPLTDPIPLATIGTAPPTRTGTLPNGVTWTVDRGTWNLAGQGYVIFGGQTQTWTFDRTVSLRFSVRGLTGAGECMRVPPGSVLVSVAPSHSYDPATRLVCYTANVPAADSFFTLGPTTSLALVAVNGPLLGRGPGSIQVTFDEQPGLSIVKSSSAVSIPAVGEAIPYSFVVTNIGNVTMTGIAVTDPNTSGVSCPLTTLAPGVSTTCTGTHTVVQGDIDTGVVSNTATVTGIPPSATPFAPVASNTVTIVATQLPALSIVKSSTAVTIPSVGETIPYSFELTNSGNVTMTGIAVTDANTSGVSCPTTTLAPGVSTTCIGTHTVVQGDLDAGELVNRATLVGLRPDGTPIPPVPSNEVTITGVQNPALSIVKASPTTQLPAVGATIPYSFLVTNIGDVTMTGIDVTDPDTTGVVCLETTLAPGISTACSGTRTVTQGDVDAGEVVNTATVVGTPPSGTPIPPVSSNEITIPADQNPALAIVKASTTTAILAVGEVVPYTFTVTNIGDVTMSEITVTDPDVGDISFCPAFTLAPGAATTCTGNHTVTQADIDAGELVNTAIVVGTPPDGTPIPPAPSNEVAIGVAQIESLSILKTPTTTRVPAVGATIGYRFAVTNTGNVTITDIAVTDANTTDLSCPQTTLAPGASTTCTGTHIAVQADIDNGAVVNTATVTGRPPDGTPIPPLPSNEVTVTGTQNPALSIVKASTTTSITAAGQPVPYTFTVTNTGDVTVTDIAVADPIIGAVTCPQTTLDPGASITCTATYTITPADVDNGQVVNTATVTGTPPDGTPMTPVASNQVIIDITAPTTTTTTATATTTTAATTTTTTTTTTPDPAQLPATGSNTTPMRRVIPALILTGTALLLISRHRRRTIS